MWLFLALLASISLAVARILQKTILSPSKHDPLAYAIYFQLSVAIILLPVAIINRFTIPPFEKVWFGLLLTAVTYTAANIFIYQSMKKTPISEFTILFSTIPIWTAITSSIVLNESTNPMKIFGILLTVVGIIVAFYRGNKFVMGKSHYYALIAAICCGVAFTNDAVLLHSFNSTTYSFIYWFWPGIFMGILFYKKLPDIKQFAKDGVLKFFSPSVLFAAASLAINTGYKIGGEISQIATIVQLSTMLTIVLGIMFLHEREHLIQKLIGGAIVVLGVILVQIK